MIHFEVEVINGDVMVLETLQEDFKIVINIFTGEVIHVEFVDMTIQKFNKYITHAKNVYLKRLTSKSIKELMEEEE